MSGLGPGATFGDYLIGAPLGEGAHGAVFRARDGAGRVVALKILKARLAPRARARFEREGQVTAGLNHPGIVKILGGGERDGVLFLAYELVDGAHELWKAQRPLPLAGRLRLLLQVAEAIGFAHEQGIVHRDLKSENVLVDPQGRARVADFGLARFAAQEHERLTQTGALVGTPYTMSPEQFLGARGELGPHSDVWALGILLYHSICGRYPFDGGSWLELQVMVCEARFERPSSVVPGLNPDLDAICLKALARDPEARYPDGAAFAADLRAHLAGQRPSASTASRLRPPALPSRRLFLLAAPPLLAVLVLVAVFASQRDSPAPAETPPPAPPAATAPAPPPSEADSRPAFERLRDEPSPPERILLARAWLARFPRSPLRDRVEAQLRRDACAAPMRVLEHSPSRPQSKVMGVFLDSETVLTAGADGRAITWNLRSGSQRDEPTFAPPSSFVALARVTGGVALAGGNKPLTWVVEGERILDRTVRAVQYLAATPDGRLLVAALTDRRVLVFDASTRTRLRTLGQLDLPVHAVAISADGETVAVVTGTRHPNDTVAEHGRLRCFATATGELVADVGLPMLARCVAFRKDGSFLLGTPPGALEGWDLARGTLLESFTRTKGTAYALAHSVCVRGVASLDARTIVSAGGASPGSGELAVWDATTRRLLRPLSTSERWFYGGLAVSPDARTVAVSTRAGVVEVWAVGD